MFHKKVPIINESSSSKSLSVICFVSEVWNIRNKTVFFSVSLNSLTIFQPSVGYVLPFLANSDISMKEELEASAASLFYGTTAAGGNTREGSCSGGSGGDTSSHCSSSLSGCTIPMCNTATGENNNSSAFSSTCAYQMSPSGISSSSNQHQHHHGQQHTPTHTHLSQNQLRSVLFHSRLIYGGKIWRYKIELIDMMIILLLTCTRKVSQSDLF